MTDLPAIYADLDPKIAPLVNHLRECNYPTSHSCEGHVYPGVPWVTILAPPFVAAYELFAYMSELEEWLIEHNIDANIALVFSTMDEDDGRFPFIRIEVLSDLAEASLG